MDNQVTELRQRLISALKAMKNQKLIEGNPIRLLVELHISHAQAIPRSNEKSQANHKWFERLKTCLEIFYELGVIFTALTFIFSIRPQWIPGNNDFLTMANAGDVSSQIYLADHYYRTGQYEDSIYWYSIASIHSGEAQGVAYNNLAYLYAKGLGVNDTGENAFIHERTYKLFKEATQFFEEKGDFDHEIDAERNALQCLTSHTEEDFSEIMYYDEIEQHLNKSSNHSKLTEIYYSTSTYKGPTLSENDIKYQYSGAFVTAMPDSCCTRTRYMYCAQDYVEGAGVGYELVYMDVSEME